MGGLGNRITIGQLEPADVVRRYVALVEADNTDLANFIPADIVERTSTPKRA